MEDNKNIKMPPKRRMGPPGRGMAPVEKAKDFKGSIGKLIRYIGSYKTVSYTHLIHRIMYLLREMSL